ncbi:YARHG domain-containing protein [Sphingobacterium spiritivorum]|uniref:YARHG domain-containing protein n=1 Tax=Sphingobacterium spiritivorum TaxID=258 RepID=UPI003DA24757
MKRVILIACMGLLVIASCKDKKKDQNNAATSSLSKDSVKMAEEIHKELYGNWVGDFVIDDDVFAQISGDEELLRSLDNLPKINLTIKRITADTVLGQNIVRGNMRPVIGKIEDNGGNISFILDEPGDKKSDGRFEFKVKGDTLIGSWRAFDTSVKVKKRNFKLLKKQFAYNPNLMLPDEMELVDWRNSKEEQITEQDGDTTYSYVTTLYRAASPVVYKINASKEKLTEAKLKNLKKLDLEIIRNTIFARHGYAFTKVGVRQFFDPVEWYVPISNDVSAQLSTLEKDNIKLLKKFEKYAEDNYDSFGR